MNVPIEQIEAGYELPPLSHVMNVPGMTQGKLTDPNSGEGNPIHFDEQFARQQGLKAPVATGITSAFYANQLLTEFFGEDWLRGGSLATKFIAPMYLAEAIICKAKVTEKIKEDTGYRLNMELWSEKSSGQKNMVGSASVLVRQEWKRR